MWFNLDALRQATVHTDPFPFLMVPNFLPPDHLDGVIDDFPKLDMAGIFPPEACKYGPKFAQVLQDMQGAEMRAIMHEKFGVDVSDKPTMATIRGCARARDGQIHADATFKLVTNLLYLNRPWESDGGRLRALRSRTDIEDYVAEVPPNGGTLFAFKCVPTAWHGHKSFEGVRRYLMINYCADQGMRDREVARHAFSARMKKLARVFGIGKIPNIEG